MRFQPGLGRQNHPVPMSQGGRVSGSSHTLISQGQDWASVGLCWGQGRRCSTWRFPEQH